MKNCQIQKNIPNGWKFHKLDDLLTSVIDNRGKTPPIQSSGIPMVEVNAIGGKKINYSEITKFVSEETSKTWFRKHLKKNDILFSTVGRTASCSIYKAEVETVVAQNLIGLRFGKDNPDFMFYLLTQDGNNREFKNIEMSAAQPSIKVSQMIHLEFLVPPLPEQNRIVSVLETWDSSIEKLSQKIEIKKQIKKGLMQNLLTGKKRLRGFNDDWGGLQLRDIGQIVTGNTPSKKISDYYGRKYLWATALDFNGVYIDDTEIKLSESGKSVSRVVPAGSILVTCIASIGKNAIAKKPMSFNQQINAIVPNKSHNSEFIYYLIESSFHKLKEVAGGGAMAMISKGVFEKIRLNFPKAKEEQIAIAEILTTADLEITTLEKKLSILKEQKRFLLNNLITGTIRTPENLSIIK